MSPAASLSSAHCRDDEKVDEPNQYDDDAEKNYKPKTFKFWAILLSMYMAIFLVSLVRQVLSSQGLGHHADAAGLLQDRTIVAVAIPAISNDFKSIQDIAWYGSAYMLTGACSMPICGRLYQIYSTKWTFLVSILVFEIGSAICGAAPNSIALILGRAIAGLGSSGMMNGAYHWWCLN
jgi:MFS family permease